MRCNVDMLKIIQLGMTLCDEMGNSPELATWQFNFKFNLKSVITAGKRSLWRLRPLEVLWY